MIIQINNATKKIRDAVVLNDVSYTFEGGKIYGLQGKNGSGKTMLIRAICGLISLSSGSILHDEKTLGKDIEFPESVGLLLEAPGFLPEYSGKENLKQIAGINNRIGDEEIENVIREVGLDPSDRKKYRKYSLGMKQRLGIACAVMENPKLIILDEPTNALDVDGVRLVREILRNRVATDRIIIIASHDAEELNALADEIINMESGHLAVTQKEIPNET